MRTLGIADARAALVGGAVMGCGGGGEIAQGMELVERYAGEGLELRLAEVDELPESAMVVCPYGVGSLDPDLDDPSYRGLTVAAEYPALTAVKDLQQHMGIAFDAVISGELGGWALADAFDVAAALGVPLLDADPAGRAVPEVQHSLLYVGGISITPQVITNEFGESIVVQRVANDFRDEALVRAFSTISRGIAWVADHPAPLADVRRASIPGALSTAEGWAAPSRTHNLQAMRRRPLRRQPEAACSSAARSEAAHTRTATGSPSVSSPSPVMAIDKAQN